MALPSGKFIITTTETVDDVMIRSLTADTETRSKAGKSNKEESRWVLRLVTWTQHKNIFDMSDINDNQVSNANLSGKFQGGAEVSLQLDEIWNDATGEWQLIHEELISTSAQGSEFVTQEQHWIAASVWSDSDWTADS